MRKLILMLMAMTACVAAMADETPSRVPLADPFILVEAGTYYAYGTHAADGIEVWTSTDLTLWTYKGLALDKADTSEDQWFWAPEVYHKGNEYLMYYSANEHLYVASADSPMGPFKQIGSYMMENTLGSEKCIDSTVFFDEQTGKTYLFFVRFTDGNCIWQVELADDYVTPIPSTLKYCFSASLPWETLLGKVVEGPFVVSNGSRYFLTYSANDYRSQDYAVSYASTKQPIDEDAWTKLGSPMLCRIENLVGTGHHSIFTDLSGKLRIVFHAHASESEVNPRGMYIGTLEMTSRSIRMTDDPIIRPTTPEYSSVSQTTKPNNDINGYFSLSGIKKQKPQKGLNIVLYSNGTKEKQFD